MRWTNPKEGDFKYKLRFLFLPKTLNGETRWLEPCWIYTERGYTYWWEQCFADWKWRSAKEGTWLIFYSSSIQSSYYRMAKCSLCGHEESFRYYKIPTVCPKCEWNTIDKENENETETSN